MLSRMAESLYWLGRYVERADGTSRILDAYFHGTFYGLDQSGIDAVSRRLIGIMGADALQEELGTTEVLELLAYDNNSPSSISSSLNGAWENARGVREAIPGEVWEVINGTVNRVPGQRAQARRSGPDAYLAFVRGRCAQINGHIEGTMSRDAGWRFLTLGRALERADMTARLVAAERGQGTDLAVLLKSCGGHEPYLRAYRGRLDRDHVAEFLVSDRLFPRSLLSALDQATEVLTAIEPPEQRIGSGGEASRILGAAKAQLAYSVVRPGDAEVRELLRGVQSALASAHSAIAQRFFQQAALVHWVREGISS
jgi:uncharacterized alpha-E superfamily protein